MTSRLVYEGLLIELSKTKAPSILLQDFNYFINKAITQYINKRYNIYDINQQTTDDLRVLSATSILDIEDRTNSDDIRLKLLGANYEVILPDDYLHLLNCVCVYEVQKGYKCYNKYDLVTFPAKRITSDSLPMITSNYYNRPIPERPYFYIHNINNNFGDKMDLTPTNSNTDITKRFEKTEEIIKSDEVLTSVGGNSNFPRSINLGDLFKGTEKTANTVEREIGLRYGNASKVRMEIRCGQDTSIFKLKKVLIDYLKTPQHVKLTLELINLTEDTSLIMEFPDYGCQEIINELTMLVMGNISDPRLQTNTIVTQSIANPAQQLTSQQHPQ